MNIRLLIVYIYVCMGNDFIRTLRDVLDEVQAPQVEGAVDFVTFVTSPRYLGISGVYPFWLNELQGFDARCSRLLLTGSLGGGKTTCSSLALLYRIYLLFLQGDVCRTLGLMQGSPISCLYFSVSKMNAKRTGFQQLKSMIDNSAWFRDHAPRDKKIESSIRFIGTPFSIDFASGESDQIGGNVWGFVLDEANFRSGGVGNGSASDYTEVLQLAQQLEDRQLSRFARGGVLQSFACYVSSAAYSSSFIDDKMVELRMDPDHSKVIVAVQYKICPDRYSKKTFEVFVGYDQLSPCIVQSPEHKEVLITQTGLPRSEALGLFEQPPVDLLVQFKKNVYLAIQNHCGRSTATKGSFITNYEVVKSQYDDSLESPFSQDHIILSNQDDIQISSIIDWGKFKYPERPHSLYLDLASTSDEGSLTCVRFDGLRAGDGLREHTHVFTLRLLPPVFPAALQISKVQNFILELADHIQVSSFGSDQYQSLGIRQEVSAALDLPDIRISLDSTDMPHLMWLSALVDKRLRMQFIPKLDQEIREAVHDVKRHRVVKVDGGSDDQFQGIVGAYFLSETVGSADGDIKDLIGIRANLVGSGTMRRMMKQLGYTGYSLKSSTEDKPSGGGILVDTSVDRSRQDADNSDSGSALSVLERRMQRGQSESKSWYQRQVELRARVASKLGLDNLSAAEIEEEEG